MATTGTGQAIGKVFILQGTAKAVAPDGTVRVLGPNSVIFADERIITESDGAVSIMLDGPPPAQIDLGRMSDVLLNEDVYAGVTPEVVKDASTEAADAEKIQQSLLEGDQPIELDATAAGGAAGAGGMKIASFTLDGAEGLVSSGAETTGVGFGTVNPIEGVATEAPTEAPTEPPTEAPTEAPTPAPTEAPTEVPTEVPTDHPTDVPTDHPTDAPTHAPDAHDDANLVKEAGVQPGGNTPLSGDPDATGNVLGNDHYVDHVVAVNGDAGKVGVIVTSDYGSVAIATDGSYTYHLDNTSAATNALSQGEIVYDTFQYTVTDEHGLTATADLVIKITGTNDVPVITSEPQVGLVTEIADHAPGENETVHTASGAVIFTDVDTGDIHTAAVVPNDTGYLGTLTINTDGIDSTTHSVGWRFSVDDSALDSLAAGQQLIQTYTVTVTDKNGAWATQEIIININGADDALNDGKNWFIGHQGDAHDNLRLVTEGNDATFNVQFHDTSGEQIGHVEKGTTVDVTLSISGEALLNTDFSIAKVTPSNDFTATYELNDNTLTVHLTALKDTNIQGNPFDVTIHANEDGVIEGPEHLNLTITDVSIGGIWAENAYVDYQINDSAEENHAPTVGNALTAGAEEDKPPFEVNLLHGAKDANHDSLHVDDVKYSVDGGEHYSATAPSGVSLSGATLTVDPADAAFQHLAEGKTQTITVGYDVVDEHGASVHQTANVTITGVNDVATITGVHTATLTALGDTASGVLTVTDPDDGESLFKAPDIKDLDGKHGTFTFDKDDGHWTYEVTDKTIKGDVHDTLEVKSYDGTAMDIDVLITPPDDTGHGHS